MDQIPRFSSLFFGRDFNSVGIPFLICIFLSILFPKAVVFPLMILFAAFLFLTFFLNLKRNRIIRPMILAAVGILLSFLPFAIDFFARSGSDILGTNATVEGYVTFVSDEYYDLSAVRSEESSYFGTIRVASKKEMAPYHGDRIRVFLCIEEELSKFDRAEGLDAKAFPLGKFEKNGLSYFFTFLRGMRQTVEEAFGSDRIGGFFQAILLGNRSSLSEKDQIAFEKTGSAHLLAISGLHVTQILGLFYSLLPLIPVRRRIRPLFLLPLFLLLFFFTGGSVSVFRACVMGSFPLFGTLFSRRSDSLTALVFAACLLTGWNPWCVLSPSFLLSFGAVFSILVSSGPLIDFLQRNLSRFVSRWRLVLKNCLLFFVSMLLISVFVFLFTFPIQLFCFDEVCLLAPLYSSILIPLFPPCLILSAGIAVFSLFSCSLFWLEQIASRYAETYLELVQMLAKWEMTTVSFGKGAPLWAMAVLSVLAWCMIRRSKISDLLFAYLGIFVLSSVLLLFCL